MSTHKVMEPKVSVLLASFNGLQWIEQQLRSIQVQKHVDIQLTISDDGSTDGTVEWLLENLQAYPHTLLESKTTGSAGQNFFRLLKDTDFSDVDYVALSDQDDLWLEDKLKRAIDILRSQHMDAYSSNVTAFWPDNSNKLIHKAQPQQAYDYLFESAGPGCTFVITKRLAIALQAFLNAHSERCQQVSLHDWFIYAFARSRGYQWYIDHSPSMLYRQHAHNVVGANSGLKSMRARWQKLSDGWYRQQILLISSLLNETAPWPIRRLQMLNLFDRIVLAYNVKQLRRRLRDQLAFVFFILFLARKP